MNILAYPVFATEHDLRLAIVETGRICYENGLMPANNGNISVRMGEDRIIITPATLCKGRMDSGDLLVTDLDGVVQKSHPRRNRQVSSESPMHLEVYRRRSDVHAVIHAHPPYATALTVANQPLPVDVLSELLECLGPVPTSDFATPSSQENADAIQTLIQSYDVVLLRNHGILSVGKNLEEALVNIERVEHVAKVFTLAQSLGQVQRLPAEMLGKLNDLRAKLRS